MKNINLRDLYPEHYTHDCFTDDDISAEIPALIENDARIERAALRKKYWHQAYFSLDAGDGIERDAIFPPLTPDETLVAREQIEMLYAALAALPEAHRRRIYASFFLGMTNSAIAQAEGVSESSIRQSIRRGLRRLKKFFEKF
jgi:RNA polymerase sigma-70 factor (ECF subfamily)